MIEVYRLLTRWWTGFALAASLLMLAIAHAFERFGGLPPCNLCLRHSSGWILRCSGSEQQVSTCGVQYERQQAHLLAVLVSDYGALCGSCVRAEDDAVLEEASYDGGTSTGCLG